MSEGPTILFDGACNLCNHVVQFVLARDPDGHLRFAALQSSVGQDLLNRFKVDAQNLDTVVFITDGRACTKSDAALRIAGCLSGLWPVLKIFLLVPRPLRDWAYDVVARNRYRWFGKKATCMAPSSELLNRFLS